MLSELFFPLLSAIDQWMAPALPLPLRILLWGVAGGMAVISIYALLSGQKTIAGLKQKSRTLRKEMMQVDLPAHDFARLVKENLRVSLGLLLRVFAPALIAAIPVIVLASWIYGQHGYTIPGTDAPLEIRAADEQVALEVQPSELVEDHRGHVVQLKPSARGRRITLLVQEQAIYTGKPFQSPVPEIEKKKWWHALLGSDIGYLHPQAPIDQVLLDVRQTRLFPDVPAWLARWEWMFFLGVFAGALVIKFGFHIE